MEEERIMLKYELTRTTIADIRARARPSKNLRKAELIEAATGQLVKRRVKEERLKEKDKNTFSELRLIKS